MRHLRLLLIPLLLVGCGDPNAGIPEMNRGIAEIENFDYLIAADDFREALKARPDWKDAKVNLAIALLNLRGPENHAEALEILHGILEKDPDDPHANFLCGFLYRIAAEPEKALEHLNRVLAVDPTDPGALYWKGIALGDLGRNEEAEAAYRAAIKADPYLAAAYHSRFTRLKLLGRHDEAMESLKTSKALREPPGKQFPIHGDLITAKAYHEIGKYAMVIRNYEGGETPPVSQIRPVEVKRADLDGYRYGGAEGAEFVPVPREGFASDGDYVLSVVSRIGPGVAVGDFDGDGDTDAYLPEWGGAGRLYTNEGKLRFADATAAAGIATECRGVSATFFDADGDGDLDLYVACAGPNVFYENAGDGTFADRTAESGLAGDPGVVSLSALPGDFDHEGDIDLFVAGYCRLDDAGLAGAPDALFQNNRDGTFTDVAAENGVDGGDARSVGALALDIDRDLDTDLLVIRDRAPAALWLNERIWRFREGELPATLTAAEPAWGAAAGDVDRDGREEVLILRGPGVAAEAFRAGEHGVLEPVEAPALRGIKWRTGAFLDLNLDGTLDLVGDGAALLDGLGKPGPAMESASVGEGARGLGLADFDGDGDLDRLYAGQGGAAVLETVAPAGNHWLALELVGREALQPAAWSARTGPGSELELRAGRLWQPLRSRAGSGFLSTLETPVRFGMGEHTVADLVRILWPDRVLQVEAEIPADQVKTIAEVNRKPSSCPMLFAWDGERFRFVTDFLGVGGLGFFLGPDLYGEPDGDEYVRIGEWPAPLDGDIVLQALEPLEEISYLDEATLVAVDHPAGMEVYPNERYVGERARFPAARIFGISERVLPAKAADASGKDVLSSLLAVDRVYAPVEPDLRFPGVAKEHATTLDFTGRVPAVPEGGRLVLFLDGWIEYGYSNTFFAAYQAGIEGVAPTLEFPDGKGGWEVADANIGCPAGLPKCMTVDVTGIVTAERPVFRIRSNYEVYWDRISLAVDDAPGKIRVTRLAPRVADLHDRGYPREFSPDGRQPLIYDYGIIDPGYPFKNFVGAFTRFGEVRPLLTGTDDRYVITGHGEELTLRYAVKDLPPLPEGMARTLLLYASGWCKDMDPYTAHPDTVGPLPFRGMSGYPYGDDESYPDTPEHRRYQEEWNTRQVLPRTR